MEIINIDTIKKEDKKTIIKVSFVDVSRLNVVNAGSFSQRLTQLVTTPGSEIYLNLENINFIDTYGFDELNKNSKIAKKYHSKIILVNVNKDLKDLIDIVCKDGNFDIVRMIPQNIETPIA